MKKKNFVAVTLLLCIFVFMSSLLEVEGADQNEQTDAIQKNIEKNIMQELDFGELDNVIAEMIPDTRITFEELLDQFLSGNIKDAVSMLGKYVKEQVSYEFVQNKKQLVYMIFIALIAAFFTVFCQTLGSKQAAEVSFFIMYALLMILCIQSFQTALESMELHMQRILLFMKVFYPCYFIAMGIAAGSMSAMFFYELVVLLIFLVEAVILNIIVPIIRIYILIRVMDYMTKEEKISEFADLLKTGIEWSLKAMLGIVVGLNIVQTLLTPVIDSLKRNSLTKTVEALPGVGNVFGSVTELLVGTTVLIKNGIGVSGMLIILLLCATPVIQNAILLILYRLAAAAVQPMSDKRVVKCIQSVAEGYELMMKVLFTTMLLFLLTIAITAAGTS